MPLWEIEPAAAPDDPYWQGRQQWARVVVRADTAAWARLVAEDLDTPEVAVEYGHEATRLGSGFKSEKLYHVRRIDRAGHPEDGPAEVLEAIPRENSGAAS